MRVERALEKLRRLLEGHGITSTGAALSAVLAHQAGAAAPAGLAGTITAGALAGVGPGAAAGSGMGGVAAMGSFLTMKTSLGVVSAIAVLAVGGAVYQTMRLERARAEATRTAEQAQAAAALARDAQEKLRESERRVAMAEARAAAEASKTETTGAVAAKAPGVASISAVRADGSVVGTTHFEDTPEGKRAMVRHAVAQTFGAFFRKLGWDERQQERFKDLWADRKEAEQEKFARARAEGKPIDRALAQTVFEEASREFDERLRTAFGRGVVEAKRDYEAKGAFRHVAEETAKRVFYTDAPLSHQQADQLAEIMALNSRRADGKFDIAAMNLEAVLAQAQAGLTPAQLAAFREVEAEQRRQRELEQKARAQREAAAPAKG